MTHVLATSACAALLLGSVTACGTGEGKSTLPACTGGSTPSATTTQPATTAPAASPSGPVPLVPHATFTYGGLKVVVDQPASLPKASRSSMMAFSELLQGMGRTTARNRLDPALKGIASTDVVKYVPRIKMRADVFRGMTGPEVTGLTLADGTC